VLDPATEEARSRVFRTNGGSCHAAITGASGLFAVASQDFGYERGAILNDGRP